MNFFTSITINFLIVMKIQEFRIVEVFGFNISLSYYVFGYVLVFHNTLFQNTIHYGYFSRKDRCHNKLLTYVSSFSIKLG